MAAAKASFANEVFSLGTLTPFYRGTQLQGHLIGMGLQEIPSYLLDPDVDLRYRTNPQLTREIPFVDVFTIVRFMGGYPSTWLKKFNEWNSQFGRSSLDYVVRSTNGELKFRPNLIRMRLAPYLSAGYRPSDITLALDNVPWALAEPLGVRNVAGVWGQRLPPDNMATWTAVVKNFSQQLKAYIGPDVAAMRFETGVEYDQKVSFDTDQLGFLNYYLATFRGLEQEIHNVQLSPGEFNGIGKCVVQTSCVYDTLALLRELYTHKIPISMMPRSLYGVWGNGGLPSKIVNRAVTSYARLPDIIPEVHQFSLIGQPFSIKATPDPGAGQATWQFQVLIGLWRRLKPRRVYHWGGFSSVGKLSFLNGAGFIRLILDRYQGAAGYQLPATLSSPVAVSGGQEVTAVLFQFEGKIAFVVARFALQLSEQPVEVKISLPTWMKVRVPSAIHSIRYNSFTNVFVEIRNDFDQAGNLKPEFGSNKGVVGAPMEMAIDSAVAHRTLAARWPHYVEVMKNGLRWRRDNGIVFTLNELGVKLVANEIVFFEIEQ